MALKVDQSKKSQYLAADVVEVYEGNFFKEIENIANLATKFNYVSMVSTLYSTLNPWKSNIILGY